MSWPRTLALSLALAPLWVGAQDESTAGTDRGLTWMLVLSAMTDEDSYANQFAGFNLGLRGDTWLSLATGTSRAPSDETNVRAHLVTAGVEHDFGALGIAVNAENWGEPDNLETRDLQAEIFRSSDRLRLALRLEQRTIDVYFSGAGAPIFTDLRRVTIDADGIGISGRLEALPGWRVFGSWTDYDYPRGINLVPRADRLDLLSTSAVTLAYGFVDYDARVGFDHDLGGRLLTVDYAQERSTIAGNRNRSVSTSMLWPVARRIDVEVLVGANRVAGGSASLFGGLSLLLYGGS